MPELRVRAGVLTGNAAVEVGAEGEGMVLGDTVNTASRLQSIAAPGTVLVDDVTRRASEAAIAYEDAGEHQVKGREQPVHAWTALRVVAGAGGARRSAGLEAPFVGRDRELAARSSSRSRQTRRAAARPAGDRDRRGRLGQVAAAVGVLQVHRRDRASSSAGTRAAACPTARASPTGRWPRWSGRAPGSSRRRTPAQRAREAAGGRRASSSPTSASAGWSSRGWLTCSGSSSAPAADRADLFSRLAAVLRADRREPSPVVLVFEDLQWADSGLLDFIDYLLEWSADYPIFVLALGPARAAGRAPGVAAHDRARRAASRRGDDRAARRAGPGLPDAARAADPGPRRGVPLYAVETVRMLLDRGLLAQEGTRYVADGRGRRPRGAGDASGAGGGAAGQPRSAPSARCSRTPR